VICRCRPSSNRQAIATRCLVGRNPASRSFDAIAAIVAGIVVGSIAGGAFVV
jgi:hypothetical protein